MSPFLAVMLEQCHEAPGSLSSGVIAATAYDAKSWISALEQALSALLEVYDGTPMTGAEAESRAETARRLLAEGRR